MENLALVDHTEGRPFTSLQFSPFMHLEVLCSMGLVPRKLCVGLHPWSCETYAVTGQIRLTQTLGLLISMRGHWSAFLFIESFPFQISLKEEEILLLTMGLFPHLFHSLTSGLDSPVRNKSAQQVVKCIGHSVVVCDSINTSFGFMIFFAFCY